LGGRESLIGKQRYIYLDAAKRLWLIPIIQPGKATARVQMRARAQLLSDRNQERIHTIAEVAAGAPCSSGTIGIILLKKGALQMAEATSLLVWGIVVHWIADWLLQNDWMAMHKVTLRHPAAWVHGAIHTLGLCLIFTPWVALLIGISHLLIDTRGPLLWWMHVVKQIPREVQMPVVEIWLDQVMHIAIIAAVVLADALLRQTSLELPLQAFLYR